MNCMGIKWQLQYNKYFTTLEWQRDQGLGFTLKINFENFAVIKVTNLSISDFQPPPLPPHTIFFF